MIKNARQFNHGVNVWFDRLHGTGIAVFRKEVWELFNKILRETPQYSGRAVANWRIGLNSIDGSTDPDAGDDPSEMYTGESGKPIPLRQKGDPYWIQQAQLENWWKVRKIKRDTRVFITNSVVGDSDDHEGKMLYMQELQDPGYWAVKLRAANKPYETATETILKHSWANFRDVGGSLVEYL